MTFKLKGIWKPHVKIDGTILSLWEIQMTLIRYLWDVITTYQNSTTNLKAKRKQYFLFLSILFPTLYIFRKTAEYYLRETVLLFLFLNIFIIHKKQQPMKNWMVVNVHKDHNAN